MGRVREDCVCGTRIGFVDGGEVLMFKKSLSRKHSWRVQARKAIIGCPSAENLELNVFLFFAREASGGGRGVEFAREASGVCEG